MLLGDSSFKSPEILPRSINVSSENQKNSDAQRT
jgi:hypothetical protein